MFTQSERNPARRAAAILISLATLFVAPSAFAASPTSIAVTVSPLHLIIPLIEVTGEFRLLDQVSVAGIVGAGRIQGTSAGANIDLTLFEIGVQGRYYVLGNFNSGLQLGVEAMQIGVAGGASNGTTEVSAKGRGLSLGAFAGYKHTFGFGLVLDGQLGYSSIIVAASGSSGSTTASTSESSRSPLLNLNIGWAF